MEMTAERLATTRRLFDEPIQAHDWIEWAPGVWTRISEGSSFIGETASNVSGYGSRLRFRRDKETNK